MDYREKKPRPRLDDKLITSWNGLALSGLCDAYRYCQLPEALAEAKELAAFIETTLSTTDGGLLHSYKAGGNPVNGYLEDYASVIQGYIKLYSITRDPSWMDRGLHLAKHTLEYFSSPDKALLYFSSSQDRALIRRTVEVNDSVIPSSNSSMAKNLFLLGAFFAEPTFTERATAMIAALRDTMEQYPGQYSNWMHLALWLQEPFYEVVLTGPEAYRTLDKLQTHYLPHTLLAASQNPLPYPLFNHRDHKTDTRIFLCRQGACLQPLTKIEEALEALRPG
jgi:uncharacterized protein YyaL (SSP411 family)